MKTYPIFLASSFELQPEREKFEIFIGRQNKRLVKKNVMLELDVWEDMGAELNNGRKQNDYNKRLQEAEIVLVLFWTKMGKYTREEFELAYQRFLSTGRPLIYVYEKTAPTTKEFLNWEKESKLDFINQLLLIPEKEQFHSTFEHYGELLYHFQQTLFDLFDKNKLIVGSSALLHSLKAPHSPSFVIGREKELETISEKLSSKGNVVVISGEGGMGKTTLAAKYWHENKYTYGHCAYLFCERGILNAMMDDGLGLELQGMDEDEKTRQIQRKLNGLRDEVLLFLDNANDAGDINEFLNVFSGFSGNVMITSRSRDVLPNTKNEILLGHLDPRDAKALFLKEYHEETPEFDELVDKLLKAIDYHTLLVEVFSKNLGRASARGIDLKTFMGKFESEGIVLERKANIRMETDYAFYINKQVATPNDILEALYNFSELNEDERHHLVKMALLPVDAYRQQFLVEMFEPEDETLFYETLDNLYRNGWIGGTYDALRLSPVMQKLVLHKNQKTLWDDGKDLLKKLTALIKYEEDRDNAYLKFRWIPYGRQLARIFKDREEGDFALFLNYLGILFKQLGGKENLLEAKTHLEKALSSALANFGKKAPSVAGVLSNLGLVLKDLGGERNLLEAKILLEKSLDSALANYGEEAPAVAIRRSNLGLLLRDLGGKKNLLEAKVYLEKALESDIRNFGEEVPSVAISRSNMAAVLRDLGDEKNLLEAKAHLERSLALDLANFGEDATSVSKIRSNLALVLRDLGGERNLLEAKILLEKSLASDIVNFGEDAPDVAISRSNLALVLRDLRGERNLLEAKILLEKSLASDLVNFGEDAPSVARSLSNLGLLFLDLGGERNLLEAKTHLEKALESNIRNFGKNAPSVALSSYNLAAVMARTGTRSDLKEAKKHLKSAKAIFVLHFGEEYPMIQNVQSWMDYVEDILEESED